ncbi:MAG TPA: metallopeptidase TldD-related protein [Gemmatimonadales bacterium]|nr:metallopeptidase TldD-related protein [Gemmatimonadales bacterium]
MSHHPHHDAIPDDAPRLLSKAQCEEIARRIFAFANGGETRVWLHSWWNGELRWARNRVSLASDRRDLTINVERVLDGVWSRTTTNQTDDASLQAAVRAAERQARRGVAGARRPPFTPPVPDLGRPDPAIWSDVTYGLTTEARAGMARRLAATADAKGLLSAGYIETRGGAWMHLSSRRLAANAPWDTPYVRWTQAQCSMTVRDPAGTGSGWAGGSGYDWAKLEPEALAQRALEKCIASRNPVTLEPGRYTVILEPQAVADLIEPLVGSFRRDIAEGGLGPWALALDQALGLWRTKLGLKVVDERITISHDPADPELGIVPEAGMQPVTWIDRGILTKLTHPRAYALTRLNTNTPVRWPIGYRMSGGETSVEEMIKTTKRGLLVTRLSNIAEPLDFASLLLTGLTRDGLWLIENGQITKAVKNFRFTESPLFVLNSIEQLGPAVPVFRPVKWPYDADVGLTPAIVPALKARDFSFTSTIDAI